MRRSLLRTSLFAAVATTLAISAPQARADLMVNYSVNGGAFVNLIDVASGTSGSASGTLGGVFTLNNLGVTSNSPGSPSIAELLSDTLVLTNSSGADQNIVFAFSDIGYSSPTSPPNLVLNSHIGGTVAVGSADNLATFTGCVSTTNTNLDSCTGATTVAGPGSEDITAAASFKSDETALITSLSAPYSITSILDVTLGAGSQIGFQDNSTVVPVPEPVSLSLLGVALIGLGAVRRRRSRRT